jgi:hypothetical protein
VRLGSTNGAPGGAGQGAAVGGSPRRSVDSTTVAVIDECSRVLQLEGDKGLRSGRSI